MNKYFIWTLENADHMSSIVNVPFSWLIQSVFHGWHYTAFSGIMSDLSADEQKGVGQKSQPL